MLNKNQSNKRNSWKYATVLPLLGAFLFFFQVKVVAQEKATEKQEIINKEIPFFIVIDMNTSDKEIKEFTVVSKTNYDVNLKFSKVKRNSIGEIIAIKAEFTYKDGRSGATEIGGTKPIKGFYFFIKDNEMGFSELKDFKNNGNVAVSKYPITTISSTDTSNDVKSIKITNKEIFIDGSKVGQEDLDKLDPNTIETIAVNKESGKSTIKIRTKKGSNIPDDIEIFVDGKKISKEEMDKLDTSSIESINVTKNGITPGNITIISRKTEINDIDQAKKAAEQAKIASEQAKKDTQQAKIDAEQAKWDAEKAKKDEEAKKRK